MTFSVNKCQTQSGCTVIAIRFLENMVSNTKVARAVIRSSFTLMFDVAALCNSWIARFLVFLSVVKRVS